MEIDILLKAFDNVIETISKGKVGHDAKLFSSLCHLASHANTPGNTSLSQRGRYPPQRGTPSGQRGSGMAITALGSRMRRRRRGWPEWPPLSFPERDNGRGSEGRQRQGRNGKPHSPFIKLQLASNYLTSGEGNSGFLNYHTASWNSQY